MPLAARPGPGYVTTRCVCPPPPAPFPQSRLSEDHSVYPRAAAGVAALARALSVRSVLYVSSSGVYGAVDGSEVTEDSPASASPRSKVRDTFDAVPWLRPGALYRAHVVVGAAFTVALLSAATVKQADVVLCVAALFVLLSPAFDMKAGGYCLCVSVVTTSLVSTRLSLGGGFILAASCSRGAQHRACCRRPRSP